jgi:2,3-dihydroxybiphenyl 1,2-dioxygenase
LTGGGVAQLGYLGFEVKDPAAWEAFATGVLGLAVVDRREGGAFGLRMDRYRERFFLRPGETDDLTVVGWQVPDEASLAELTARLRAAGFDVTEASPEEAAERQVERLVKLRDPAGIPTELFHGRAEEQEPFASPLVRSGFLADERGLGHVVLRAGSLAESMRFYCDLLGFRLSDRIVTTVYGHAVDMAFLHANTRHHSVALGERLEKRLHHFMIEVRSMDDVGLAFDRALRAGVRIAQTLGRHPNDRMFSFYAVTPSGFQFEVGWGGREVDDATWVPATYDHISEWGHHPPEMLAPRRKPKAAEEGR